MATYKFAIFVLSVTLMFPYGSSRAQSSKKLPKRYKHHYYFVEDGDTLQKMMNKNFKWSKNNKKNRDLVKWVKNWNIAVKNWKDLPEGKRIYFKLPFWKGERLSKTVQSFDLKKREKIPVDKIIPGLREWEEQQRLRRLLKYGKAGGAGAAGVAGVSGAGKLKGRKGLQKNKEIVSSNVKGKKGRGKKVKDDWEDMQDELRSDDVKRKRAEEERERAKRMVKPSDPHKWLGLNWKFALTYTMLQDILTDKQTSDSISSTQVSWLGAGVNVKIWNQVPDPEFVFVMGGNMSS
ncbi:MAG: hypothetical protein KC493_15080, partial [Bacteriovoracaceae bacterium]|nr:hypothetical protein [Bacteriovoracaceae bacterium]